MSSSATIDWQGMTGRGTPNAGRLWWGWGTVDGFIKSRRVKDDSAYLIVPKTVAQLTLRPPRISLRSLPKELQEFCTDDKFERAFHSRGRDLTDILECIHGAIDNPVDIVAFPKTEKQISQVFDYCGANNVSCIPFGGGSSVVWGVNPPPDSQGFKGTVTVDMIHFNKLLDVDEKSMCARVQAGVYGPALEEALKKRNLTLRYFPQSFEFSTFGGWLATRGGGHFATGPTHIDDLVESLRIVTPRGTTQTARVPASGAGPAEYRQYLGSEGIYGIITEGWVRVRPRPKYRSSATIYFEGVDSKDAFLKAAEGVRKVVQTGIQPANLRLVDGEEMESTARIDGLGSKSVVLLGFESFDREDMESDTNFVVEALIRAGGKLEGERPKTWTKSSDQGNRDGIAGNWGKGFMSGGYTLSETTLLGLLLNTFETAITWDKFPQFYKAMNKEVMDVINRICGGGRITCRFTHVYPDGPAPYFTVIANGILDPLDLRREHWMQIKQAASKVMIAHGATSTHHHAVGKLHADHFMKEHGELFEESLYTLKSLHDPKGILNPDVLFKRRAKM